MSAKIGEKVPSLKVSKWVQGLPTSFDKEKDHVVLVEVFQVNCPGCFLYGIPEAINIYNKYRSDGVVVLGVATAFEDFDKNTLENLELLLKTGEVTGDTKEGLGQYGKLEDSKLPYKPDESKIKGILLQCLEEHFGNLSNVINLENRYYNVLKEVQKLVNDI